MGRAFADMAHIKQLCGEMGVETIMFPDTSDVLNCGQTGEHDMYPKGGTKVSDLQKIGSSQATISLGVTASEPGC